MRHASLVVMLVFVVAAPAQGVIQVLSQASNCNIQIGAGYSMVEDVPIGTLLDGLFLVDYRDAEDDGAGGYKDWTGSAGMIPLGDRVIVRLTYHIETTTSVVSDAVAIGLAGTPDGGVCRVLVDGTVVARLDVNDVDSTPVLVTVDQLIPGLHTLRVEITGCSPQGNPCPSDVAVFGGERLPPPMTGPPAPTSRSARSTSGRPRRIVWPWMETGPWRATRTVFPIRAMPASPGRTASISIVRPGTIPGSVGRIHRRARVIHAQQPVVDRSDDSTGEALLGAPGGLTAIC